MTAASAPSTVPGSLGSALPPEQPFVVGAYEVGGKRYFLDQSYAEAQRAIDGYERIIANFEFAPLAFALIISGYHEAAQTDPLAQAFANRRMRICRAEPTVFEAGRVEAVLRRMDPVAVFGLNAAVLDGLIEKGFDPATILAGRVVWARSDCYSRLKGLSGVTVLPWVELGPALALGCRDGGLHVDSFEWSVEQIGRELAISSRLGRLTPFNSLPLGIEGQVDPHPCTCGNADTLVNIP